MTIGWRPCTGLLHESIDGLKVNDILTADLITRCLDRNISGGGSGTSSDEWDRLDPAAVLVPLYQEKGAWRLLLIRRSGQVATHKSQIAFPGGRRDDTDQDDRATALRETREEIGLDPENIRVLGFLSHQATSTTGFLIVPVVGVLSFPFQLAPAPEEVAGVLSVPLDFFLAAEPLVQGDHRRYQYGEDLIWGATAAIIEQLILRLKSGIKSASS
ncbi:MAG: CoA pyrophosphatase [Magnetococcales bacterium]|nr:CoA pyrophosphatase [Magnetococcales bacterium]